MRFTINPERRNRRPRGTTTNVTAIAMAEILRDNTNSEGREQTKEVFVEECCALYAENRVLGYQASARLTRLAVSRIECIKRRVR